MRAWAFSAKRIAARAFGTEFWMRPSGYRAALKMGAKVRGAPIPPRRDIRGRSKGSPTVRDTVTTLSRAPLAGKFVEEVLSWLTITRLAIPRNYGCGLRGPERTLPSIFSS